MLAPTVAYFSMEIALEAAIPTYAGGLGVLAGDTIRSAADLGLSLVAVSLVHRHGYFHQQLDANGAQSERDACWQVETSLEPLAARVEVEIEGRAVALRAWRYRVRGVCGDEVPVYLLDADLPENAPDDRALTHHLYGGDSRYRLCQETLLGIGGVRMLRALGHTQIDRFHLNEGHAALAVLELLEEETRRGNGNDALLALAAVRKRCVFTTHTPVPAGHDRFPSELVASVVGDTAQRTLEALGQTSELNLTDLALRSVRFVNGVAMRHGEVSARMFPQYPIRSITNGIHPATWAAPAFRALFDLHFREWRRDAQSLRYAVKIPLGEIWWAHTRAKRVLLERLKQAGATGFREEAFTIGFARRSTAYKRSTLLFHDPARLRALAQAHGPLQLVFAGKAHPADDEGKHLIRARLRGRRRARWRDLRRLSPGLRHGDGSLPGLGLRPLAQHPGAAARGLGHERHEGGPERRAESFRARRLVGRGPRRGRHRLVDRERRRRCRRALSRSATRAMRATSTTSSMQPCFHASLRSASNTSVSCATRSP